MQFFCHRRIQLEIRRFENVVAERAYSAAVGEICSSWFLFVDRYLFLLVYIDISIYNNICNRLDL